MHFLESYSASLFESFSNNQRKANTEKFYLLMNVKRPATIKISEHTISNSYWENLLCVKIDSQLNFNNHLETIIKQSVRRYMFWLELRLFMYISKRKLLMNAFFEAQFSDCPLGWMCLSRSMNEINRLHERCLRILYNDKTLSFEDLFPKELSLSIYTQEIQKFLPLQCLRYIITYREN